MAEETLLEPTPEEPEEPGTVLVPAWNGWTIGARLIGDQPLVIFNIEHLFGVARFAVTPEAANEFGVAALTEAKKARALRPSPLAVARAVPPADLKGGRIL